MIEYVLLYLHLVFLVSATITEITSGCTTKIVHIIWTTVSHCDVFCPATAVAIPEKTHPPADLTICYCRVATIHPARYVSVTPVIRWTWSWYSCAGGTFKTKPSRADTAVTLKLGLSIIYIPVGVVQTPVILTFWHTIDNSYKWSKLQETTTITTIVIVLLIQKCRVIKRNYYSFKILPRFWLAESKRLIHHNRLLMTKFGRVWCLARKWRQKCSVLAG